MGKMTEDDKGVILGQILADVICERSLSDTLMTQYPFIGMSVNRTCTLCSWLPPVCYAFMP